jgi:hypothetical protein
MKCFNFKGLSLLFSALLFLSISHVHASNLKGQNHLREQNDSPEHKNHQHTTGVFQSVYNEYQLFVKFKPSVIVKLRKNKKISFSNQDTANITDAVINNLIKKYQLSFSRLLNLSDEELDAYNKSKKVAKANRKNKKFNILNFGGLMEVNFSQHRVDSQTLLLIANALESSDLVEYAELSLIASPSMDVPAPSNVPVPLAEFSTYFSGSIDNQGYQRAHNPSSLTSTGVDVDYAWALGLSGQGILLHDIETDWGNLDHEEFLQQDISYGSSRHPKGDFSHGVGVVGILMADANNGIGIKGAVPNARMRVWPQRDGRVVALLRAADESPAGSIIILEQQQFGVDGSYVPADYHQSYWDAIESVTNAGIHVIAAAGNGNVDLDSSAYDAYRGRGDNGSIRVGAGYSNNRSKLSFSTYGSPIHIQGWGRDVYTTSSIAYTPYFNGTSSATPIATQAVALIQECLSKEGRSISPLAMRQLLIDTGIPQGAGGHIGPLPNIKAALESLACTGNPSFEKNVIVEAEDYIRANDNTSLNEGGEYRKSSYNQGVDIENSEFDSFNVGYTEAGEWLEYYVALEAGTYQVETRVATFINDSAYTMSIADANWQWNDTLIAEGTGGWQNWQTHDAGQVVIPEDGVYTVRIDINEGGTNLNRFKFSQVSTVSDADQDGVADIDDQCPDTPFDVTVDEFGCEINHDADNDGVADIDDQCPNTAVGVTVNELGCEINNDADNDGVADNIDQCPNTATGLSVDIYGCANTFIPRVKNAFDRSFDTTLGNSANADVYFDSQNVDLELSQDTNTIGSDWVNIGYIDAGEWLEYDNITIVEPGSYMLKARIASFEGAGGLTLTFAGSTVTNDSLPSTGDWQAWQTVNVGIVNVDTSGQYTLRIDMNAGGFNLNYIELERVTTCSDASCLDTDVDGINDNVDLCPNTTQGVNVDTNGCEIIEEKGLCTDVAVYPNWSSPDWKGGPNTHNEANDKMVYQGQLYLTNWYTSSIPGSDETWSHLGSCSD